MVMGTVGYMSPEQVRGKAADHRADIFAFGAILYEMLAGNRAFGKPTSAETMTAILNEDPPAVSQIVPSTPLGLQRMVHRCLEKNPEQRFQSASDLAFALEAISESGISGADGRSRRSNASLRQTAEIVGAAFSRFWRWSVAAYFLIFRRDQTPSLRISDYAQITHDGQLGGVEERMAPGSTLKRHWLRSASRCVSGGAIQPCRFHCHEPIDYWTFRQTDPRSGVSLEKGFTADTATLYGANPGWRSSLLADALCRLDSQRRNGSSISPRTATAYLIRSDGTGAHKFVALGGSPTHSVGGRMGDTIRYSIEVSYGKCPPMALICMSCFRAGELRTEVLRRLGRLMEVSIPSLSDQVLKSGPWMSGRGLFRPSCCPALSTHIGSDQLG